MTQAGQERLAWFWEGRNIPGQVPLTSTGCHAAGDSPSTLAIIRGMQVRDLRPTA